MNSIAFIDTEIEPKSGRILDIGSVKGDGNSFHKTSVAEFIQSKRQLYVGMTRAKRNLTIHSNGNYLDNITAEDLERIEDRGTHLPPNELTMHLSLKDVWLDYFITRQHLVSGLTSGDILIINGDGCTTPKGQSVLKFSRQGLSTIEAQKQSGYHLKQAKVNFIVYWFKEDTQQEVKIILPELYFEKK